MAGFSSVALAIGALASVAGTTYSIVESEKQKERAQKQAAEEKKKQEKLLADMETEQKNQEKQESALTKNAETVRAARTRRDYSGTMGRGSTISTSPLGLLGSTSQGGVKKALLGE